MRGSAIEQFAWNIDNRILEPAEILEVDSPGQRLRVRLAGDRSGVGVWAQIAIAAAETDIRTGGQVLVIGDDARNLYVIGNLTRREPAQNAPPKLALGGGAYATSAAETLRVFSAKNELLFEYDEKNRRARVNVECGDLEFCAQNGNIAFSSGREILIQGQSVGISSSSAIRLETTRLHVAVQTLVEKAKSAFRTVEQLSQVQAGRMRTLIDGTYFFKAGKAFIKSDEDYKIKAEKIHLG